MFRFPIYANLGILLTAIISPEVAVSGNIIHDPNVQIERTSFQNSTSYDPRIDIKSDVVMVYGIGESLPERIATWKKEGYRIHIMTGVAWGNYDDYLDGEWDGINHRDCAQTDKYGKPIMHGKVPYICPTESYGRYLCEGVKVAIDAGAEAIHLEEPEFWSFAGYSEAFKREWQSYYNEPWIAPHTSPDANYRSAKLKYFLYERALRQVFDFIRDYGKKIGRDVKCYVATHSMINYAWWGIVSPESNLIGIEGCDGYIGQVWTGTARTPNMYKGVQKERTFESAYFEYGVLQNLVRSTGKRMWYLNDPIEDNPRFCWEDYRVNWESTLVASLLWPEVWRYEVMPWPSRIFTGRYPIRNLAPGEDFEKAEREEIPAHYATELLAVINELNFMNQPDCSWDHGTGGIGILVSDTMMFQREFTQKGALKFDSFFGIAMPLVKKGARIEPVQMENSPIKGYLDHYKVLFATYYGQKPPSPKVHDAIDEWVKAGGVLVFVDDDKDAYNGVREWWNTAPAGYSHPRHHLFEKLKVSGPGMHKVGNGTVIYEPVNPESLALSPECAQKTVDLARRACDMAGIKWKEANYYLLNRGPYVIAAGLDETDDKAIKTVRGCYVNMFSPTLEVQRNIELAPGKRFFLKNLNKLDRDKPQVVASASKILEETVSGGTLKFHSEGPINVVCVTRVALPSEPKKVTVDGSDIDWKWDSDSKTALITYPNSPDGLWVEISL